MTAPNDMEKVLIKEFRESVRGILDNERLNQDHYLLRWIRAREGNLDKAKEMLQGSLEWRKEKGIDNILNARKSPYFEKNYKYWIHGVCKIGRPLLVVPCGTWKLKEVVNDGKSEELMLEFARMMEDVQKSITKAGNLPGEEWPITQFIAVCDWSYFGYSQVSSWGAVSKLLDMVSKFEAHYPETVHAIYFLNCPRLFNWVLPLMKQCMSMKTLGKLQDYGMDQGQWLPEILKEIDKENLFIELGGMSQKPDEPKEEE